MALKLLQSLFLCSYPLVLFRAASFYQASHKTALASTRIGRNETGRLGLLSIKAQITHDPMLITSSWNDSLHFCQWKGVLCGQRHPRVTRLNLESYNLAVKQFDESNPSFFWEPLKSSTFHGSRNMLEGNIPGSLGSLIGLRFLGLARNKLSGIIPPSIYNLSSLAFFWAPFNQFHGSLPQNLGLTLPNIQKLGFAKKQLSGLIPRSISKASKLELLDLAGNKFSPGVPINFGKLKNLSRLYLFGNGLGTGDINDLNFISTLVNCSKLIGLYIANNSFRGVLPNSIANFSTQLQHLFVGYNKISGSIPQEIGNLVSLNTLDLVSNQMTGSIPTSIGRLHKLQAVAFAGNKLSGQIPSSLLYGNNLSSSIPREVIGLSSLSISLDISRNSLRGPLPQEVGNLRNLGLLNLSHNKLSSEIPSNLIGCIRLQYLYLDNNSLKGVIPQSLESLRGIEELDLSYNSLSGEIPKFWGSFSFLRKLDLSFNDLEGEIPVGEVFQNASAISVSGNNKLCGGIPALELPSCPSDKPRKKKMPLRLALLIPTIYGVLSIILTSSILILCWLRKIRKQPSVASSSMDSWRIISYNKFLKATNGFSLANLIGTGSFGSVYKGILNPSDQKAIAVKQGSYNNVTLVNLLRAKSALLVQKELFDM
ncbi:hypothetical protein Acr_08g0015480 [Actinidia rufa]|uniref:Leucine-rich repeat-containing N-terminal plant-type domain-containing protein n=1 Tax=Actinidia rufa TaxID=165716 RepID=A0A7J0F387_9ERIC|nr:hypothetical protein Acr_08g0015480 [Actinidia rufa]